MCNCITSLLFINPSNLIMLIILHKSRQQQSMKLPPFFFLLLFFLFVVVASEIYCGHNNMKYCFAHYNFVVNNISLCDNLFVVLYVG